MQWAVHLRNPADGMDLSRLPQQLLTTLGREVAHADEAPIRFDPPAFERIYVGDEFCAQRLPRPAQLQSFFGMGDREGIELTLLTPILTDEELEKSVPLFDCLVEQNPRSEVVVNDWGVLCFLRERYPLLRIAAGRVLNKAFKDPRRQWVKSLTPTATGLREVLSQSSFDRPEFQRLARQLGIERLERDLPPHGRVEMEATPGFMTSVYFPFGYVTSGRVCWIASFDQAPSRRFIPGKPCARSCQGMTLELTHEDFAFPVVQNGNTVFYLYCGSMLRALLQHANNTGYRLVYQGLAF